MKHQDIIRYLNNMGPFTIDLKLHRIRNILDDLGNPQKLRIIHIAGTNGKGSVCMMTSQILIEAGFNVGTYTSPHLMYYNERIKINAKDISDSEFEEYFNKIIDLANKYEATPFEILTSMAFLYFKDKRVDFAVVEVGLGGRLDATNIIEPLVSVITNISLDHIAYLGKTAEKIAREKAGIIKKGIPVITGAEGSPLEVIKEYARKKKSEITVVKKIEILNYDLGLKGEFQKKNAAIVLSIIDFLKENGFSISDSSVEEGFLKVKWPGRFEILKIDGKNIILDCCHNTAGAEALKHSFKKFTEKKPVIIVGIMTDKDKVGMLRELLRIGDDIITTKVDLERASGPNELKEICLRIRNDIKVQVTKDVKEALDMAFEKLKNSQLIVVTGSCYVVGEAKKVLRTGSRIHE